ncbi:unnamed protein product [Adineta steineri]|uniref:Uncharacterized protein n=1 Tax=Adineta steineri TaxID=433720 RepID=A0A815GQR9_9BILA|nr:unnamed protein product [Adineta steineri]CAF1365535.1 unnamed protein product [Adineta steineri]CAF1374986.1 unnamed protein product [Adineta steineri]CAF3702839.1 unnamed protein product [Adineta steineri]CAF3706004.1 unnamed protein product [Adineta steineri]
MDTNNELSTAIINLINTTVTDGYNTGSTQSMPKNGLKYILFYTIPLSCLVIIFIIITIIRQRHRVLDKWTSLKRMRNTNPRFLRSVGLRRDSEFDSFNQEHVHSILRNQENSFNNELQYQLATIT